TNQGTLVIVPVNGQLGVTVTRGERLLAATVNGVTNTSSNVNGIVPANIVYQTNTSGDAGFVSYGTAAQGFIPGTPTTSVTSLTGAQPTAVATITSNQSLTG